MRYLLFGLIFFISSAYAQTSFKVLPLGVKGGSDESNLSCYAIAAVGTNYVCLDAGTITAGLQRAAALHSINEKPLDFLRNNIKGYLISHGHLDHLSGMVLNSPDDSPKNIYVLPFVKDVLKERYFTPQGWTNFADEGEKPLNKYHYITLDSAKEIPLASTTMFVTAFPLSHGNPYQSSAFLIRSRNAYALYLGDTGADIIEKTEHLRNVWKYIAPLVQAKKLKAIFIECSFSNEQPDNKLFGHLTPKLLMDEMEVLYTFAGKENMNSFALMITHIKPAADKEAVIRQQLSSGNKLKLKLRYPQQGKLLLF